MSSSDTSEVKIKVNPLTNSIKSKFGVREFLVNNFSLKMRLRENRPVKLKNQDLKNIWQINHNTKRAFWVSIFYSCRAYLLLIFLIDSSIITDGIKEGRKKKFILF